MNPMEVRQCVYQSEFLNDLKKLNELPAWRSLLGSPKPDKRLKDVELLLRVVALFRDFEHYEKPMKGFLNSCALEFALVSESDRQKETERLKAAIEAIDKALGAKPFHLRGRLNYSALDATLVAVMRTGKVEGLSEKFKVLVKNEAFMDAVSFNTSDEAVLKERIDLAISTFRAK